MHSNCLGYTKNSIRTLTVHNTTQCKCTNQFKTLQDSYLLTTLMTKRDVTFDLAHNLGLFPIH